MFDVLRQHTHLSQSHKLEQRSGCPSGFSRSYLGSIFPTFLLSTKSSVFFTAFTSAAFFFSKYTVKVVCRDRHYFIGDTNWHLCVQELISSTFYMQIFHMKANWAAFLCLELGFEQTLVRKCASKMLMKLTPENMCRHICILANLLIGRIVRQNLS